MFFDGSGGGSEEEMADNRPLSELSSRKSEGDFEKIEAESGTEDGVKKRQTSGGGSWMPWSWGAQTAEAPVDTVMGESKTVDSGKSSGVDA